MNILFPLISLILRLPDVASLLRVSLMRGAIFRLPMTKPAF